MEEKKESQAKVVSKKPTMPAYVNFILAGASGMMAICLCQPADLLKTRMQLLGTARKNSNLIGVARNIVKNEGFLGFYVGLSAAMFRQATYTTSKLGSFNALFDIYRNKYGVPNFPAKVFLGMVAGGFGSFVGTPAELVLIRMTADGRLPPEQRRNYKHVFNALARITREEGVTTLWRGAVVTVIRAMIVNGAALGSYAQSREMLEPQVEGFRLHALAALISSLVATVVSMPFDIVKTRVQNSEKGASIVPVLVNVIKNEGVLAMWSGMVPTYLKIGPMTIIIFVILEQLNALYYKYAATI